MHSRLLHLPSTAGPSRYPPKSLPDLISPLFSFHSLLSPFPFLPSLSLCPCGNIGPPPDRIPPGGPSIILLPLLRLRLETGLVGPRRNLRCVSRSRSLVLPESGLLFSPLFSLFILLVLLAPFLFFSLLAFGCPLFVRSLYCPLGSCHSFFLGICWMGCEQYLHPLKEVSTLCSIYCPFHSTTRFAWTQLTASDPPRPDSPARSTLRSFGSFSRHPADRPESSLSIRSPYPTNMAGIVEVDRTRNRRERTFVGSECAVCEEPLEHTLRGERVLQFSCAHVSHEACFYEYIREFEGQYCPTCDAPLGLDTSRGGNVLDIGMCCASDGIKAKRLTSGRKAQ